MLTFGFVVGFIRSFEDMKRNKLYAFVGIGGIALSLIIVTLVLVLLPRYRSCSQCERVGPKIVIDQDGGSDDAMAIFLALLYEKYFDGPNIIAITTGRGNVDEPQVFENTQRILDIANRRDVPIYRGSTSSLVVSYPSDHYFGLDGLGDLESVTYTSTKAQPEHAALALIELSKKYEGELEVVTLGAATNVALALRLDPYFISRLSQLFVAAGNVYSPTSLEPEFNAFMDVEGYHVITEHATPYKVTFIPFSPLLDRHNISMDWRVNEFGAIDTAIVKAQNQFDRKTIVKKTTWSYLDPQAMSMVLNRSLIEESKCTNNSIILCGEKRGINTNNFTHCEDSNANIALPGAQEEFMSFLYSVFSADENK